MNKIVKYKIIEFKKSLFIRTLFQIYKLTNGDAALKEVNDFDWSKFEAVRQYFH